MGRRTAAGVLVQDLTPRFALVSCCPSHVFGQASGTTVSYAHEAKEPVRGKGHSEWCVDARPQFLSTALGLGLTNI